MSSRKSALANRFHPWCKALPCLLIIAVGTMIMPRCTSYDISILSYDSEKAYNGLTFLTPYFTDVFHVLDMEGEIVYEFDRIEPSGLDADFEIMEDGGILILGGNSIYKVQLPDTIEWVLSAPAAHHCAIPMPNGHIMYLYSYSMDVEGWDYPLSADGILEVNPVTGEVLWDWRTGDHLSTDDYCPWHIMSFFAATQNYDWTHANTIIYREEESAVYLNIRHLDRIVKIDYPSGEVLWSLGVDGDFGEGLFSHAHDPELLENGNFLMFDNGNHRFPVEYSRAVEIAFDPVLGWAEVAWAWPDEPFFFDSAMGDASSLPNGNVLITSSHHGRLFEVTRSGEVVWDLMLKPLYPFWNPLLYKCERVSYEEMPGLQGK